MALEEESRYLFQQNLQVLLEEVSLEGMEDIISWGAHGRCFSIHKPSQFVSELLPRFFRQSKLTSFQRQLNLYGFGRLTGGRDRGSYYHELFLRGRADLCKIMLQTRVIRDAAQRCLEPIAAVAPNFYAMPTTEGGNKDQLISIQNTWKGLYSREKTTAILINEDLPEEFDLVKPLPFAELSPAPSTSAASSPDVCVVKARNSTAQSLASESESSVRAARKCSQPRGRPLACPPKLKLYDGNVISPIIDGPVVAPPNDLCVLVDEPSSVPFFFEDMPFTPVAHNVVTFCQTDSRGTASCSNGRTAEELLIDVNVDEFASSHFEECFASYSIHLL